MIKCEDPTILALLVAAIQQVIDAGGFVHEELVINVDPTRNDINNRAWLSGISDEEKAAVIPKSCYWVQREEHYWKKIEQLLGRDVESKLFWRKRTMFGVNEIAPIAVFANCREESKGSIVEDAFGTTLYGSDFRYSGGCNF